MSELIFHIAEPLAWSARSEAYAPESFETEGFIHCSTASQLGGVVSRFYPGREDLVLLAIDLSAVRELLVFEDLYDTGEDFPHIYGPIPLSAIVEQRPFSSPDTKA